MPHLETRLHILKLDYTSYCAIKPTCQCHAPTNLSVA